MSVQVPARFLAAVAAVGLLGPLALPTEHASAQTKEVPSTTTVLAPVFLDRSVSFLDAQELEADSGAPVVGYRYENPEVVGEVFLDGREPREILTDIVGKFGTEPRITRLIVEVEVSIQQDGRVQSPIFAQEVPERFTTFEAVEPSYEGVAWDLLRERPVDQVYDGGPEARSVTTHWEPNFAEFGTRDLPGGPEIWERYVWNPNTGHHPVHRDLDFGLEFEIVQYNDSPLLASYARPFCIPGYSDHFWASNLSFNWSVYAPFGYVPDLGAYGDFNDLSDPCSQQTMAVGLRNPGLIYANSTDSYTELAILIGANPGVLASWSRISGVIQAVEGLSCDGAPWYGIPHTDCMGLNASEPWGGPGVSYYLTLNESRGYLAPDSCWNTYFDPITLPDMSVGRVWKFDCLYLYS